MSKVALRCFAASAGGLVLGAVAYVLLVHTAAGRRFDYAAHQGALEPSAPGVGFIDGQLSKVSAGALLIVMGLILVIGFVRRRPVLGGFAAFAAGGAVAATHVLRFDVLGGGTSFPSDHVSAVVACALALVVVCPVRLRVPVAVIGGAVSAAVAVQVQVIGWHLLSDSVGGILVAFAFVSGVAGVTALFGVAEPAPSDLRWVSIGLMMVGATVVGGLVLGSYLRSGPSDAHRYAYLIGVVATVFLVSVLESALLLSLGNRDLGPRPLWFVARERVPT